MTTKPGALGVAGGARRRVAVWLLRSLLIGPLAAGVVFGWAAPAGAHASVVSSFPASGAHLASAPRAVSVVFDEPVKPDNGGLVVLNSTGAQVSSGVTHPSPASLQAGLNRSLADGSYVANYTVTSLDGHVVNGGIVFLVGHATAGHIGQFVRRSSALTGAVDKVGQFLTYAGVLGCAGLAFFLTFILTKGPERARLRRWCGAAAVVGVAGMVVTAGAQVALTGGGWAALAHWGVVRQVVGGKFGARSGLQLVGLAACLSSVRLAAPVAAQLTAFYGTLVSGGAFVVFGHPTVSAERWLSIPADVVHTIVAAVWFGGLIGLVVVLRARTRTARKVGEWVFPGRTPRRLGAPAVPTRPSVGGGATATVVLERSAPAASNGAGPNGNGRDPEAPEQSVLASTLEVVGGFSTMAGISVSVLVVAGVLLAVAEVGSITNLFETGYGQILLVKVAVVGLVVFVAGYNRFLLLPALFAGATGHRGDSRLGTGWRRLSSTVRVEALGVVAVLAVTAVLANGTPSNGATVAARPVPFNQTQPFDGGHISLRITPNQALVNNFVVQFTGADGAPVDKAESVSVYLILPSQNVGPIITDLQKVGVGKFVLNDTPDPPIVGSWEITLQIQVDPFNEPDASFVDDVR